MTTIRKIIRANGTQENLPGPISMTEIRKIIGADGLDSVLLADRKHVMLVDDVGRIDGLPVNEEATRLYRERAPGSPYSMHGDVVVVPDQDFA